MRAGAFVKGRLTWLAALAQGPLHLARGRRRRLLRWRRRRRGLGLGLLAALGLERAATAGLHLLAALGRVRRPAVTRTRAAVAHALVLRCSACVTGGETGKHGCRSAGLQKGPGRREAVQRAQRALAPLAAGGRGPRGRLGGGGRRVLLWPATLHTDAAARRRPAHMPCATATLTDSQADDGASGAAMQWPSGTPFTQMLSNRSTPATQTCPSCHAGSAARHVPSPAATRGARRAGPAPLPLRPGLLPLRGQAGSLHPALSAWRQQPQPTF